MTNNLTVCSHLSLHFSTFTHSTLQSSESSLKRIRENQRRSRAQRKGYLRELEEKWQKCVQEGVNASLEMQVAARKLEEENKRLRALLRAKGVSEHEIVGIEGVSTEPWKCTPEGSALARLLEEKRPCYTATQPASQHESDEQRGSVPRAARLDTSSTSNDQPPYHPYRTPPAPLPNSPPSFKHSAYEPDPNAQDHTATTALTDTLILAPGPDLDSVEAASYDSMLSCEYAASIITGMKYDASASQVKLELGCGESADCKVGHAALFEVMDRYSGDLR